MYRNSSGTKMTNKINKSIIIHVVTWLGNDITSFTSHHLVFIEFLIVLVGFASHDFITYKNVL